VLMQEYLTTTSVGDLIRKARGSAELPKSASGVLESSGFKAPAANANKARDLT
jgi:hypothetical protein